MAKDAVKIDPIKVASFLLILILWSGLVGCDTPDQELTVFYFDDKVGLSHELLEISHKVSEEFSMHSKERAINLEDDFQQVFRAASSRWALWFGPNSKSYEFLLSHSTGEFDISVVLIPSHAEGIKMLSALKTEFAERGITYETKVHQ